MALARVTANAKTGVDTLGSDQVSAAAMGSALTNGSFIVACFQIDLDTSTGASVTDTAGNTYTLVASLAVVAQGSKLEIWVAQNTHTTSSNVVKGTVSGVAGVSSMIMVEEWTGGATSSVADKTTSATGASTALDSGATATLSQAAEMVIVFGVVGNATNVFSLAGSFTNLVHVENASSVTNAASATRVVAATTAVHGLLTSSAILDWGCIVATFKELTAAPTVVMGFLQNTNIPVRERDQINDY